MSDKKNILVVGFGAMGCRHVQSLMSQIDIYNIYILELSEENIKANLARIGAVKDRFTWIDSLELVDSSIDIAIIATSSEPRFRIVKTLLENGVKYFLLEKIVFQSTNQFETIIKSLREKDGTAYCNFVNRYFNSYNEIKFLIEENDNLNMIVYGGTFGLGCNAIHYIDIFQYLTSDNNIVISDSKLKELNQENRRGSQYKEFSGTMSVKNSKGQLQIISEEDFKGEVTIIITLREKHFVLNEGTGNMFEFDGINCKRSSFVIQQTSKLTAIIVQEILSGVCRLTEVQDTLTAHTSLFEQLNKAISKKSNSSMCCPIT